jgi:hypothetical protein
MKALAIAGLVALAIPCSANAQYYPIQPHAVYVPPLVVPAQPYQPIQRPAQTSPGFLYPSVVPDNSNSIQTQHLLGGYMRQIRPGYQ